MKKIVPFKKDIIFKTNLAEVTSISLEHTLHIEEDNLITGEFIVSGEYKITDASTSTEVFNFNLPFDIHMDDHYILDDCEVDIYDFYYEIVNENVLSVNIEVSVNNLKEQPVITEHKKEVTDILKEEGVRQKSEDIEELMKAIDEIKMEESSMEEVRNEEVKIDEVVKVKEEKSSELLNKDIKEERNDQEKASVADKINSIFPDTVSNNETFVTYKVYIVRENDSLETIMDGYQITKDELEKYNDLKEIKIGDKLIIPSHEYAQN